jgi:hypothetical protein
MRSEKESKLKAKAALKGTSAAEYRYGLAVKLPWPRRSAAV